MSRKRRTSDRTQHADPTQHEDYAPRRPRRFLWTLSLLLLSLGVLAWFAPLIIATTDLRQQIVPRIFPDAKAEFTIGSASLGWLSPVQLRHIQARDAAGQPLLEIESVTTQHPLWQLVRDSQNLGKISVHGLTWHAEVEEEGTNLESAFAESFTSGGDGDLPTLTVEVLESRIELNDRVAGRTATLEIPTASVQLNPHSTTPIAAEAAARVSDGGTQGELRLNYVDHVTADGNATLVRHQLNLEATQASLRPLACILRRLLGPCDVGGLSTGQLTLEWTDTSESPIVLWGQLSTNQLQFASPQWLGQEVFQSQVAAFSGSLSRGSDRIVASNAAFELDHGKVNVHCSVPLAVLGRSTWQETLSVLANEDVQAGGTIDLAKLAAALPQTFRIRQDTTITGGELTFSTSSQLESGFRKWGLHLQSSNLTAQTNGRPVVWNQPIDVQLAARQGPTGPQIDHISCHCDFLQLGGNGHLNDASFNGRMDLSLMAQRLSDFVDLGGATLAGKADLNLRLSRASNTQQVAIKGGATLNDFQWNVPESIAWQEKSLQVKLNGTLTAPPDFSTVGVQDGQLKLISGNDQLTAHTTRPIAQLAEHDALPVHIEAGGSLATWAPRLAWLLPVQSWNLQGDASYTADAEFAADQIRVINSQCNIANFVATGQGEHLGHYLAEQQVQLSAIANWSTASDRLDAKLITLATTSWSLRGDNVAYGQQDNQLPEFKGLFAFRGDLRRMMDSVQSSHDARQRRIRGMATGNVHVAMSGGVATIDITEAEVKNLVIDSPPAAHPASPYGVRPASATSPVPLWTERQLKLGGRIIYDAKRDSVELSEATAESTGAKLTCSGTLATLTTAPQANLTGNLTYNLAALMHRMSTQLVEQIKLTGAETATFSIVGPLTTTNTIASNGRPSGNNNAGPNEQSATTRWISPQLQATGNFGWESAVVYGMPVGEGALNAELRSGVLNITPMTLTVSEGKLHLSPHVYLNETPAVLTLDRGPLLENVRLTATMCPSWLKYFSPLLADPTQCDRQITTTIDQAIIPWEAMETGQLSATLTIHGADVRPGPLANSYIDVIRRLRGALKGQAPEADRLGDSFSLVRLDEQQLQVSMSQGRVHHQGLTMNVGDVPVVTSGSVGIDQSLDLVAEIAVQDSWIEGKSYLVGLSGQSLKIPIRGTVSRPRVDLSIIEELGRKTLAGTANRAIRGEINGLLGDLLLPPDQRGAADNENGLPLNNPLFRRLIPPTMQPPQNPQAPTMTPPEVEFPGGGTSSR